MNDGRPTILYVENDARSRKVMQLLVNGLGQYDLTLFDDSSDFIERVNSLEPKPSLVLLDIHVDPYDGFEMLAMLRQLPDFAHVPAVAITASVMNEEIAKLRTAGFNGCVAKPIDMDTFPDCVEQLLKGEAVWRIVG